MTLDLPAPINASDVDAWSDEVDVVVGGFGLGGGTAVQRATGVEDSAEEMFKYLMAVSLEPDEEKIRAFCEDSVEHFDWIESLGMQFERSLYEEKAVIQPGTQA